MPYTDRKPDYKIKLSQNHEALLIKFGNKDDYENDERYKLLALVDIFSGFYDETYKNEALMIKYSEILVAFCHFDGKLIPGAYQRRNTTNSILEAGDKFELISNSITWLMHEDLDGARLIIENDYHYSSEDNYQYRNRIQSLHNLLDEYIQQYYESEQKIVSKYFDGKRFSLSKIFQRDEILELLTNDYSLYCALHEIKYPAKEETVALYNAFGSIIKDVEVTDLIVEGYQIDQEEKYEKKLKKNTNALREQEIEKNIHEKSKSEVRITYNLGRFSSLFKPIQMKQGNEELQVSFIENSSGTIELECELKFK